MERPRRCGHWKRIGDSLGPPSAIVSRHGVHTAETSPQAGVLDEAEAEAGRGGARILAACSCDACSSAGVGVRWRGGPLPARSDAVPLRKGFRQLVDEAKARIRTLSLGDARARHGREDV